MEKILEIFIENNDRDDAEKIAVDFLMMMRYSVFIPVYEDSFPPYESKSLSLKLVDLGENSVKQWITHRIMELRNH